MEAREVTWVNFCWVRAAGLSEPPPHYSLFCGQLQLINYKELLDLLNLKRMVAKATRMAKTSKTLIDHIITNVPKRITYTEVLPCPLVSDHDALYARVNVRITRYTPRHKH